MIPKIIHYCWLSNQPLPETIANCIKSWHKYMPDYEFIKWDYSIFPKGKSLWVDQAFDKKKYAFAADYIRLYALYNYGGIYLDSDVEILKPLDEFLSLDDMICYENSSRKGLEVAVLGVSKHREWLKECLDYYSNTTFDLGNGILNTKVMPEVVKDILAQYNWNLQNVGSIEEAKQISTFNTIPVFPFDYFSPKSYETGKLKITKNTYSIHHFASSWYGSKEKIYRFIGKIIGKNNAKNIAEYLKRMLRKH